MTLKDRFAQVFKLPFTRTAFIALAVAVMVMVSAFLDIRRVIIRSVNPVWCKKPNHWYKPEKKAVFGFRG